MKTCTDQAGIEPTLQAIAECYDLAIVPVCMNTYHNVEYYDVICYVFEVSLYAFDFA